MTKKETQLLAETQAMETQVVETQVAEVLEADVQAVEASDVDITEATAPVEAEVRRPKRPAYNSIPQIKKLGKLIEDDNHFITAEMPSLNQMNEIKEMKKAIAEKQICYGRVFAVEIANDGAIRVIIKSDTVKVIIPAEDFFAHSDLTDIAADTHEGRLLRYKRKASRMLGAVVSYTPKAMSETAMGIPFAVASRKASMDALQERRFFGPRADVVEGSVAKASIVSSGPRYVTVECLGKEVTIGTGGLSAFEFIVDASKKYKTGDGLMVAVEKLEVDTEKRTVALQLSHSLIERLEAKVETANSGMINGRYSATVISENKEFYIVVINGMKIRGLVPKDNVRGEEKLIAGDAVAMMVTGVDEAKNMVIGSCLKS